MNDILNGVSKINYGVKIRMKSREKQRNYLRAFFSPSVYAKLKAGMEYPLDDNIIMERIFNKPSLIEQIRNIDDYDLSERLKIRQDFAEKLNKKFGTQLKYNSPYLDNFIETNKRCGKTEQILYNFLKSSYN